MDSERNVESKKKNTSEPEKIRLSVECISKYTHTPAHKMKSFDEKERKKCT